MTQSRRSRAAWAAGLGLVTLAIGVAFLRFGTRLTAAEEETAAARAAVRAAAILEAGVDRALTAPRDDTPRMPAAGEADRVALTAGAAERLATLGAAAAGALRTTDGRWAFAVPDSATAARGRTDLELVTTDRLFAEADLEGALDTYAYRVVFADPSGPEQTIHRSTPAAFTPLARVPFRAAGQPLILEVGPGPTAAAPATLALIARLLTVGLIAGLVGLVSWEFSGRTAQLRARIADGDDRVRVLNQRLLDENQHRADVEQQFAHARFHDAGTGLANRRYFTHRVNRALFRLRRQPGPSLAVLMIGLARFKRVNETYGHTAGDDLLRRAAERIRECTRPADLALARIDSGAFAIMLQDLDDVETTFTVARTLVDVLAHPFDIAGEQIYCGASIGIAVRTSGYADAEDLLREADSALTRAGTDGPGHYALFDVSARDEVASLQQLETELHRAIELDQLQLHYQPIVSLATGRLAGFEALVRWDHPRQGLIAPGGFIQAAEALGLIVPLNRWTLRRAAEQAAAWRRELPDADEFYLSVNLSGHDMREADLCDYVAGLIARNELPPGMLRLELTENVMIEDVKSASELVSGLRAIGVPLLLDDFGTGYSSLAYLARFQLDYLKIDRAFVQRAVASLPDRRILTAIVHLAHDLGMQAIAEGVETAEAIHLLANLECEYAQGYYFSRPVPADAAVRLLDAGHLALPAADVPAENTDPPQSSPFSRA